jgi:NAD+ diphosphatase
VTRADHLQGLRPLPLARAEVDRAAERRLDELWLAAAWSNPRTRVLVVAHGQAFVIDTDTDTGSGLARATELILLPSFEAPEDGERYFLGTDESGTHYFGLAVEELPGRLDGEARPAGLREVAGLLADLDAGLLVHAVALENWHRTHRFCARCGKPSEPAAAGHVRRCAACGTEHYPRTDPAVIMLVTDDQDRALLGTQATWEGRYSTLAGFVEPGETLERAVAREVQEETGVHVYQASYVESQPWPFPSSLMLGFTAKADRTEITVDGEEIVHAQWFSREELKAMVDSGQIKLSGSISISRRLLELWYGGPIAD